MKWSSDLIELLLLEMPATKLKKDGFLDIVGKQFDENIITRTYMYFLNPDKNRAIAALFLDSLLQVIKSKSDVAIEFDNHFCQNEYVTEKGNRIDLLIKTGSETFQNEDYAIIIENKIFSGVHNDLEDYWNTVKVSEKRKIGVLLTLAKTEIPLRVKGKFINITHIEWINEIKSAGLPIDLEHNSYTYLNDFIKNMENIVTTTDGISEDARFFFEYSTKVLRAKQTYDAARVHVVKQLEILSQKLQMSLYGSSASWRHIWDGKSEVYYVFGFERVFSSEPQIILYLEVHKEALKQHNELRNLLRTNGHYAKLSDDNQYSKSWAHLAFKEYKLTKHDLEHFSTFLYDRIQEDFQPSYQLVFSAIYNSAK